MTTSSHSWEKRLDWTLSALMWGAFLFGVFLTAVSEPANRTAFVSALIVGGYVVAMQVTPRRIRDSDNVGELLAVVGVVVSLVAVALTGGLDSGYLLFLATPSFFAGGFLGMRFGVETAVLTSAGLIFVAFAVGNEVATGQLVQVIVLYVLMAVTFAQARRVLIEERARGDALAEASEMNAARLTRLEAAHSALASLQELANAADLNPVSVGGAALRDLALVVPYESGQVVLSDDSGTVVVARRGEPGTMADRSVFPIDVGDRHLGHAALWPAQGQPLEAHREVVAELLRPVSLAFDNILLLRSIARRAVQEERIRLSRDLHDDVGPKLASLGLGIDMAIQHESNPDHIRHLESVRSAVTALLEEVRATVADLRHEQVDSLVEQAYQLAAEVGADGPAVLVDIDEHRPPRAAVAAEVGAIMAEAIRNAVEHAEAKSIRIEGFVDRDQGTLTIEDDGNGFNPEAQPAGHFGLVGIKERAEAIDAEVEIESENRLGSKVKVSWGATS
jgi:signal transduction histidine kinase